MEVRAVSKSVRMSPRKVRLVADTIRDLSIDEAFRVLGVTNKRAALAVAKTLKSAVANAVNNAQLDKKDLIIGTVLVNEAQALKRFRPSTRGRIHPYKKRGSNITIVVKSVASPVAKPEVKELPAQATKAEAVEAEVAVEKETKKVEKKAVKTEAKKGGKK